jgi:hypothetical protein
MSGKRRRDGKDTEQAGGRLSVTSSKPFRNFKDRIRSTRYLQKYLPVKAWKTKVTNPNLCVAWKT